MTMLFAALACAYVAAGVLVAYSVERGAQHEMTHAAVVAWVIAWPALLVLAPLVSALVRAVGGRNASD